MSIWILHQALTPEEENHIEERTHLSLPFGDIPDLSMLHSAQELRHLLKALRPDDPPETTGRQAERVWKLYHEVQLEDVIAVPLPGKRELALAEVTGRYRYADMHLIPVTWYPHRVSMNRLRQHIDLFDNTSPMVEITDAQLRIAIRDRLPHGYNRFSKWKWLLALFFAMAAFHMIMGLVKG